MTTKFKVGEIALIELFVTSKGSDSTKGWYKCKVIETNKSWCRVIVLEGRLKDDTRAVAFEELRKIASNKPEFESLWDDLAEDD